MVLSFPTYARTLAAVVLVLVAPVQSVNAASNAAPVPAITVTGNGEVSRPPDLAVVSFGVETTAPQASDAIAENAAKSTRVSASVKKELATGGTISTTRYSLDPVYDRRRDRAANEPPSITGYVARNEVRVETTKLDGIGKLIDLAAAAGANRITGLSFTLEDRDDAVTEALARATKDGRRRALAIAEALGVELGRILQASTSTIAATPRRSYQGAAMAMESRMATPVDPGDVDVRASVHLSYAID